MPPASCRRMARSLSPLLLRVHSKLRHSQSLTGSHENMGAICPDAPVLAGLHVYAVYFLVYGVHMETHSISRRIATAGMRLLRQYGSEGVTMRRVARAVGITP